MKFLRYIIIPLLFIIPNSKFFFKPILPLPSHPKLSTTPLLRQINNTVNSMPTKMTASSVNGENGKIIFTFSKEEFLKTFPNLEGETNIFIVNMDGTGLTPITDGLEGYNSLNDISPDGKKVLIDSRHKRNDKTSNLYVVDLNSSGTKPLKIASGLPNGTFGNNSANKWIDNSKLAYIGQGDKGFGIYIINADGTNAENIERNNPFDILAISDNRIYWETQIDRVEGGNMHYLSFKLWWTNIDGSDRGPVTYKGKQLSASHFYGSSIAISPNVTKIAWLEPATKEFQHDYLYIASLTDMDNPYVMEPMTANLSLKWFPDNKKVLVHINGGQTGPITKRIPTIDDLFGLYSISANQDLTLDNYHLPSKILNSMNDYHDYFDISLDGQLIGFMLKGDSESNKLMILNSITKAYSEISDLNFSTSYNNFRFIP